MPFLCMTERRRRFSDQQSREAFEAANALGAEHFGTLWLGATAAMVDKLREAGYGDDLESDIHLRAGIARGIHTVLTRAAFHPNNMARARKLFDEEAEKRKKEQANVE